MTDAPTDGVLSPDSARPTWSVFICYRQDDGKDTAQWLAANLDKKTLSFVPDGCGKAPVLDVYFAETSPAGPDWQKIHKPALERARALLFVCSPGATNRLLGERDWVHTELHWWLANRQSAPLVIDPLGSVGERYVPEAIKPGEGERNLVGN